MQVLFPTDINRLMPATMHRCRCFFNLDPVFDIVKEACLD